MSQPARRVTSSVNKTHPSRSGLGAGQITIDAIVAEAATVFREHGYRKARLEDVAARLNITRPAIYYHLPNKQDILVRIHDMAVAGLIESAKKIAEEAGTDAEKFRRLLVNHARYVADNALLMGIFYEEEQELPKQHMAKVRQQRREYNAMLEQIYENGVEEGVFRDVDPRLAVNVLLGACNWTYRWHGRPGTTTEELARDLESLLAKGYQACKSAHT